MSRFIIPQPVRKPRVPVDLSALTKNTVIEMHELIADETKKTSIKSFLHLRQAAMQHENTEEFGALLQPMGQLREIFKYL